MELEHTRITLVRATWTCDLRGYQSWCLDKPFAHVRKVLKLKKKITAKGMRRTFQDLSRAAQLEDVVTRAISGHATEEMQRHYSTVSTDEVQKGIAKVISLAGVREAMKVTVPQGQNGASGMHSGMHGTFRGVKDLEGGSLAS